MSDDAPDFVSAQLVVSLFGGMLEYIRDKRAAAPTLTVEELIREVEADLSDANDSLARFLC